MCADALAPFLAHSSFPTPYSSLKMPDEPLEPFSSELHATHSLSLASLSLSSLENISKDACILSILAAARVLSICLVRVSIGSKGESEREREREE